MQYIGICAWFTPGRTLADKVSFASQVGLQGIELDFNHLDGDYLLMEEAVRQELRELRQKHAIDYPAIAVNSLCEFGMSNPDCWRETQRAIEGGIGTAAALNIPIVQLPSFFGGDIVSEQDFSQTVKALRYACDFAEPYNIVIGSENALSGERQLALVEQVDRPNFKIYFDCRNSVWMKGLPSPPILEKVLPHVCEVHLKDGVDQEDRFTPLGKGSAEVAQVIEILNQSGYSGRILLENDYNQFAREGQDPTECVRRDVHYIINRRKAA